MGNDAAHSANLTCDYLDQRAAHSAILTCDYFGPTRPKAMNGKRLHPRDSNRILRHPLLFRSVCCYMK